MPADARKDSDPSAEKAPHAMDLAAAETPAYDEILKSSALIGGASVLSTIIGIIRTKALALLLGPAGFGLIGVFGSIADLARSVAEMGINNSGVRQIAEAVGSGDTSRIARTVTVLRRISVILGSIGALLLIIFCRQIAVLTFGTDQHAVAIALLSLAVFFRLVADGQGALLQGMRRIPDLAKIGVLGALFGTVVSIPLVYFLREDGVVPSLVAIAMMSAVTSWWFSRKVEVERPAMTVTHVKQEVAALLKFGFAFMANIFLTTGAAYAVRLIVLRASGLEAAGLFQAAWTMGSLYCAYIYQGIFADFYPRLVGVARDNARCNRLVNEQTHVTQLLAVPGVIATITFASILLTILYSADFRAASEILRWICLGAALRVITQPMGFIIVAKGEQALFIGTELAWAVVNVGLSWVLVERLGLEGAGIAYFGSYLFYGLMMYPIVRILSGFRWSAANFKTGLILLSLITLTFGAFSVLPFSWAMGFGILTTIASCIYSIRVLLNHVALERVPKTVRRLLIRLHLVSSGAPH